MRALFIPCYFDGLPRSAGSARIRAEWVCKYWDQADLFDGTQRIVEYNLIVFQKVYKGRWAQERIRVAAGRRTLGHPVLLALDLCDPDFLDRGHARRLQDVLPLFDFATVPTKALLEWLKWYLPVYQVRDRVDLSEVSGEKEPTENEKPSLVWFGYSHNAIALEPMRSEIERLGLHLTIIAERMPERWEGVAHFITWGRETVNGYILNHDVVLNPRRKDTVGRFKSDNKTIHSWAMGMPVARDVQELREFLHPRARADEKERRLAQIQEFDVAQSVKRWKTIYTAWEGKE